MPRVKIELQDVVCRDTEDVGADGDEFYVIGAVSDGRNTKGIVTRTLQMRKGQVRAFPASERLVFDGSVPAGGIVRLALAAFDEDSGKDWAKYGDMVTKVTNGVAATLAAIPDPRLRTAAAMLPTAVRTFAKLASMDKDDRLGELRADIPIATLHAHNAQRDWRVSGRWGGVLGSFTGYSDWDYIVRYRVEASGA